MTTLKPKARIVPTLTQIVTPEELQAGPETVPSNWTDLDELPPEERLVQDVVRIVMPIVEARVRSGVQALMEERMTELNASLQSEVDAAVRTALAARRLYTEGVNPVG